MKTKDYQTFQLMHNLNFKDNVIATSINLKDYQNCQKAFRI